VNRGLALALAWCCLPGCKASVLHERADFATALAVHADDDDDDDGEEQEERDNKRPNFWRARIAVVGAGAVTAPTGDFACRSDGAGQTGACGPKLLLFDELAPPIMHATGAPGWRFDHWQSSLRKGAMPDGRFYINGFGYVDTGELEVVTAVFVRASGADDVTEDARLAAK
jgi:hypothetical protein